MRWAKRSMNKSMACSSMIRTRVCSKHQAFKWFRTGAFLMKWPRALHSHQVRKQHDNDENQYGLEQTRAKIMRFHCLWSNGFLGSGVVGGIGVVFEVMGSYFLGNGLLEELELEWVELGGVKGWFYREGSVLWPGSGELAGKDRCCVWETFERGGNVVCTV